MVKFWRGGFEKHKGGGGMQKAGISSGGKASKSKEANLEEKKGGCVKLTRAGIE